MTDRDSNSPRPVPDEIYVGYLPVPERQRRFLRFAMPIALWLVCVSGYLWARAQHTPGGGAWEDGHTITLHGVLIAKPYPILFTNETTAGAPGVPVAYLLVETGKHSANQRAEPFDGTQVTTTGWLVHRDGRRMIELAPDNAAIAADSAQSRTAPPTARTVGPVSLRGEIVDSKCFLGVMKPGEGKGHKQCATLCIRGGIPPMLVTRDAEGKATYYLLTSPDGAPIDPAIYPFIADPVEVHGEHALWGQMNILRIRVDDVHRL